MDQINSTFIEDTTAVAAEQLPAEATAAVDEQPTEVTNDVNAQPTEVAQVTVLTREPSKKSRATAIFQAKLVERSQGLFGSNKEFRASVLSAIQTELNVSVSSAATMYNTAKKEAEQTDPTVSLGRDPKKVKVSTGTGRRGRPVGSKNRPKVVVVDVQPVADEQVAAPVEDAASLDPVEA